MKRFFKPTMMFIFFVMVSCKNQGTQSNEPEKNGQDTLISENQTPSQATSANVKDLTAFVGKIPQEAGLFEKYLLPQRMQALLGVEYPDFEKDREEEGSLQKDGELIYFTVCRKGACAENTYLIIVDLLNNQINVMNFKGRIVRTYEEGGVIIGLTDKLANEVQRLRSKQG
jgi:hypothetical protein